MKKEYFSSDFKLGMIAGGQLGKMLGQVCAQWDVSFHVMDMDESAPAAGIADSWTKGHYMNEEDVYSFGKGMDMITYEIEHVNVPALRRLKEEGVQIYPDPEHLAIIQDKGLQKAFYKEKGIPSSAFDFYESGEVILEAIKAGKLEYPFVQKARRAGYDGKGVAVISGPADHDQILQTDSIVEEAVDIEVEIAVIASRNLDGEVSTFPMVEMEFNPKANLVEKLICPSRLSKEIEEKADALAREVIESFRLVGVLAVEMFLDKKGEIWVNEVAPRPHNSGHHTIESSFTSQYEQHLRAILNLPQGSTELMKPAVMINLLGEPGHKGAVYYEGMKEAMKVKGANFHIYGKAHTRPFRKMGHVTILGNTLEEAMEGADQVKNLLKVKS